MTGTVDRSPVTSALFGYNQQKVHSRSHGKAFAQTYEPLEVWGCGDE